MSLRAIIWDFDLTLADTRRRNLRVTRRILREISGRDPAAYRVLASVDLYDRTVRRYRNWQELYLQEFRVPEAELPRAGRLWTEYHLEDDEPPAIFAGVEGALRELAGLPQAIVSLNSRRTIERALARAGIDGYFDLVVGFEEVRFRAQKPAPDGLLHCLERLTGLAPGRAFYVGDHETDIECAARANQELGRKGIEVEIVAVAAAYGAPDMSRWARQPDHAARTPQEVAVLARAYRDPGGAARRGGGVCASP